MLFNLQSSATVLAQKLYDVCVCGTGPAGITVARNLAAAGKSVVLLEAGGFEFSSQSQENYAGTESGIPTFNLALKQGRLRYFGGTSNHWTGMCGVFEESDFWPKRYHALPGWPIERNAVLEHLTEASSILDLEPTNFSRQPFGASVSTVFERGITTQSPPTRFGKKYRDEIVQSKKIDLFINANVVDLHLSQVDSGLHAIDYVVASNYRREVVRVVAKQYVLALGTIENARILLNANKQLPSGVGNHSGFVGQCYMEHLNVSLGRFVTSAASPLPASGIGLGPKAETMIKNNIGNGILGLNINANPIEYGRLAPVRKAVRLAACKVDTVREFAQKFKDFSCVGDGVISSLIEQAPDRHNSVTLGNTVDDFGLKRAHVNWVLNDSDKRTIRTLGFELAKDFVKHDFGRIQLASFITDPKKEIEVWPHAHQMGTTRMSDIPNNGVVNADCRVHSVKNLYMAGSSVFPTGGGINPTLTIVMLSLRLAQHLRAHT